MGNCYSRQRLVQSLERGQDHGREVPTGLDNPKWRHKLRGAISRCSKSVLSLYDMEERSGQKLLVEELYTSLTNIHSAIKVINKLSSEVDIEKAMDNVREVALELLQCERVTLFLVDEVKKELRAKTPTDSILIVKYGEGIAGTVAKTGNCMNVANAYSCKFFNSEIDERTGFRTRNILCCPIVNMSGKNIAVLQALNKKTGQFTWVDENTLELFVVHIGNTLTKSRLHDKALREQKRVASLNKNLVSLSASKNLDDALYTAATAVRELTCSEFATILLVDHPREQLWASIRSSVSLSERINVRCDIAGNIIGEACEEAKTVVLEEVPENDPALDYISHQAHIGELHSLLMEPLMDRDTCIGIFLAINKLQSAESYISGNVKFTELDCNIASVFGREVSTTLASKSVEVSFACGLSIVGDSGLHVASTTLLESQLMDYLKDGEDTMRVFRSGSSQPELHVSKKDLDLGKQRVSSANTLSVKLQENSKMTRTGSQFGEIGLLRSWDIDFTKASRDELVKIAYKIFADCNVIEEFLINKAVLRNFLKAVESHYRDTPYHNFLHAVSVLHGVWMIISSSPARHGLLPQDVLALLISSLCHDVDHDGRTNLFHINRGTELSQRYNDISVMENHHCAMTFAILGKKGCGLLENMSMAMQKEIRKLVISSIIATDMSHHFTLVAELSRNNLVIDATDDASRQMLAKVILHTVDISNPVRPFQVCRLFGRNIQQEFMQQAKEEMALGLPVLPHMNLLTEELKISAEINFIDYICLPLWRNVVKVLTSLEPCVAQIKANRDCYIRMRESVRLNSQRST